MSCFGIAVSHSNGPTTVTQLQFTFRGEAGQKGELASLPSGLWQLRHLQFLSFYGITMANASVPTQLGLLVRAPNNSNIRRVAHSNVASLKHDRQICKLLPLILRVWA